MYSSLFPLVLFGGPLLAEIRAQNRVVNKFKVCSGFGQNTIFCSSSVVSSFSGGFCSPGCDFAYVNSKRNFIVCAAGPGDESGGGAGDWPRIKKGDGSLSKKQESVELDLGQGSAPQKANSTETVAGLRGQMTAFSTQLGEIQTQIESLKNKENLTEKDRESLKNLTRTFETLVSFVKILGGEKAETLEKEVVKEFLNSLVTTFNAWMEILMKFETLANSIPFLVEDTQIFAQRLDALLRQASQTGEARLNVLSDVIEKKLLSSIERLENTIANFCDYFGAQEKLGQGVTPILYEVQNQTEASAFTFSASSSCTLEDLNISPQEYAEFVREYLPLAQKRKNGEQLSDPERKKLDELPFDKVALLVGAEGARDASGLFILEQGSVFKVIFTFKDTSICEENQIFTNAVKNEIIAVPMEREALNSLTFQTEIFFIIRKNDGSLTTQQVFEGLYQTFFVNGLGNMMNSTIVLESLQIQKLYPVRMKYKAHQFSFASPGR